MSPCRTFLLGGVVFPRPPCLVIGGESHVSAFFVYEPPRMVRCVTYPVGVPPSGGGVVCVVCVVMRTSIAFEGKLCCASSVPVFEQSEEKSEVFFLKSELLAMTVQ